MLFSSDLFGRYAWPGCRGQGAAGRGDLDDEIRDNPSWEKSAAIHLMRRELRQMRRAVWPLRDVAGALGRTDLELRQRGLALQHARAQVALRLPGPVGDGGGHGHRHVGLLSAPGLDRARQEPVTGRG